MKYLIASDIHGSLLALERILNYYDSEHFDMLLLLGDILNYGPRNGLPQGLNPQAIADRLNERADSIVCVRGNCDSEVDQMLLRFPIMSSYALVVDEGRRLLLTHGHIYNEGCLPPGRFDVVFYGHTHLWKCEGGIVNTGSPTFPKGGNAPTFATYEAGTARIHHAESYDVLKEMKL